MENMTLRINIRQTYALSINEFTDNSDKLGFFHAENEPHSFFTVEDVVETQDKTDDDAHI